VAKGQQKSNRETKKPKKTAAEKLKASNTAPSVPTLRGTKEPPKGS
jgi:hypothetical protein